MKHPLVEQELSEFFLVDEPVSVDVKVVEFDIIDCLLVLGVSLEPILQELCALFHIQVTISI